MVYLLPVFQSLSGFLMSCNYNPFPTMVYLLPVFQSLSGFLMSCNTVPEN